MADNNERTPLLKVEHLSKEFPPRSPACSPKRFSKRVVSAVNDISFRDLSGRDLWPGWRSLVAVSPPRAAPSCPDQTDRR